MKPESIKKKRASRLYHKTQKGHVKSHWAHQDPKRTFHPSPKSHPKGLLAVGRWSASVSLGYMRAGAILPAAGGKNKNLLISSYHIMHQLCRNIQHTIFPSTLHPPKSSSTWSSKLMISGLSGLGRRSKNTGHSHVLTQVSYGSLQSTNCLEWWFSVCLEPLKIFEKQFIKAGRPWNSTSPQTSIINSLARLLGNNLPRSTDTK